MLWNVPNSAAEKGSDDDSDEDDVFEDGDGGGGGGGPGRGRGGRRPRGGDGGGPDGGDGGGVVAPPLPVGPFEPEREDDGSLKVEKILAFRRFGEDAEDAPGGGGLGGGLASPRARRRAGSLDEAEGGDAAAERKAARRRYVPGQDGGGGGGAGGSGGLPSMATKGSFEYLVRPGTAREKCREENIRICRCFLNFILNNSGVLR